MSTNKWLERIPEKSDPRWLLLVFLGCFSIFAVLSDSFTRTPAQYIVSFVVCVGLDLLLLRYYKKVYIFPLSGIITTFGVFLLTDSPTVWVYGLVAALSILSKHFITVNGRHCFNPNNFGVVTAVMLLPQLATTEASRWGGNPWMTSIVLLLGCLVVFRARKWVLAMSYVGFFFLGVLTRAYILDRHVLMVGAPMTGASFLLFVFYMITDPATSPRPPGWQVLFGFVLALLDNLFRYDSQKNAPFIALFILTALYAVAREVAFRQTKAVPSQC